ncbi:hypothetical protein BDV93DRAFT_288 [Ceratobasidium sp. AG-I]|nr:hypothetical protein BDV93DRAFT_288 [Ceratobasidium sp. AG-I]
MLPTLLRRYFFHYFSKYSSLLTSSRVRCAEPDWGLIYLVSVIRPKFESLQSAAHATRGARSFKSGSPKILPPQTKLLAFFNVGKCTTLIWITVYLALTESFRTSAISTSRHTLITI